MSRAIIKKIGFRYTSDVWYVWIGGSCNYASEDRPGGGACIIERNGEEIKRLSEGRLHTTEFRMMLLVMSRAMLEIPEGADIVFLTNVAYLQNFDKEPDGKSANTDLIRECIVAKGRHGSVRVKIIPYHKYLQLPLTHDMAHAKMICCNE